jgi:perosamine synthetase
MIEFSKPTLGREEIRAVTRVLNSDWLAAGPETEAFEKEFAEFVGVKYAIFTNSCTSALKMAYKWAKEQDYLSVQYPRNTFCATYASAEEIGLPTYWKQGDEIECLPAEVEMFGIYDFTRVAKISMHYGGVKDETPCLIEDSAHRIEPNDPLAGKIRCYSFYVTKNMTTGSGGMFVTNDKEIYEKARLDWKDGLSTSTRDRKDGSVFYEVLASAGGYDGNDIAAAIGREQLRKLPQFNARRNEIVRRYNEAFRQTWKGNHIYPYFVKSEEKVEELIRYLKENEIKASYHYPNTGWLGVSLPIYPLLTDEEVEKVIQTVKKWQN